MIGPRRSRAWAWIALACGVHLAAWAGWMVVAARHPVASVPLHR